MISFGLIKRLFCRDNSSIAPATQFVPSEKALLVIDIDHLDWWDPESIAKDCERQKVASFLQKLLAAMRQKGMPIVFATLNVNLLPEAQLRSSKDICKCISCTGKKTKLADFLDHQHEPFEPIFVKNQNDAFSNKELAPYLRSLGIKELLLAGCNTFACVRTTARGAIRAGFNVTLIDGAVYPLLSGLKDKENWLKDVKITNSAFSASISSIDSIL